MIHPRDESVLNVLEECLESSFDGESHALRDRCRRALWDRLRDAIDRRTGEVWISKVMTKSTESKTIEEAIEAGWVRWRPALGPDDSLTIVSTVSESGSQFVINASDSLLGEVLEAHHPSALRRLCELRAKPSIAEAQAFLEWAKQQTEVQ